MAIPKVIHSFWHDGFDSMPDCYKWFVRHNQSLHPDWEYKFWDKDSMPEIWNKELWDSQKYWTYKSTILRYQLLRDIGGVWVDVDALLLRNIDDLTEREYFAFQGNNGFACTWCLGCESQQPFIVDINPRIALRSKEFPNTDEGLFYAIDGPALTESISQCETTFELFSPSRFVHYSHSHKCPEEDRLDVQLKKMHEKPDAIVMHFMNHKNNSIGIRLHETLPVYLNGSKDAFYG